jgi:hypothetical protein
LKHGEFLRGMTAGLVAGAAIGAAVMPKQKQAKSKGTASRMVKAVGDAVNYISDAMGF